MKKGKKELGILFPDNIEKYKKDSAIRTTVFIITTLIILVWVFLTLKNAM